MHRREFLRITGLGAASAAAAPWLTRAMAENSGSETASRIPAAVVVDPYCRRSIRGISELKRETYFGLCDHGTDFDRRCKSKPVYEELVRENGITFGRVLGVVNGLQNFYKAIQVDPSRPGYADLTYLKTKLEKRLHEPSDEFRRDMGGRLELAAHEQPNAYPEFMGRHVSKAASRDKTPCTLPEDIDAAAELAAGVLRYGYTDFNRPAFFELINEPHWSYWAESHLADWHVKTMQAVHRQAPGVQVGGPCLPVAYFYKKQYKAFDGLKTFIANTRCGLDFYSFHVYDFLRDCDGKFGGRITSGLPLESVLDLVQNHTVNTYGREIGVVVSEHGGYGAEELVEQLARKHISGDGFEWEMKKRSIDDFNMVSSVVANTLVFMDHPQTIRKAVPFILLNAMGWDPRYYAVLYVPREYRDRNDWVPTKKLLFYKLFRDLKGHRVSAGCADPDIQVRAFADGKTLFLVLNNLSARSKTLALNMPQPARESIRRFGRNEDFTPYFSERAFSSRELLTLAAREAVVIRAEYDSPLLPQRAMDEIPCYGDQIAATVNGTAQFHVKVPRPSQACGATLRIGVSRPPQAGHEVTVVFNGQTLVVPLEQCAERLVEQEYASCKMIELPRDFVQENNTVSVSFPDGQPGAVGSVVIRARYPVSPDKK